MYGAEAAATQIKSNFQFPELAKIEKFVATTPPQSHTHTYTYCIYTHTHTYNRFRVPLFS